MAGIVPRLQAQVLSIPAGANNEWLAGTLRHPAGPFTSASLGAHLAWEPRMPAFWRMHAELTWL